MDRRRHRGGRGPGRRHSSRPQVGAEPIDFDASENRGDAITDSLRRLSNTVLAVLPTRLEILSTELAEERTDLARIAIVGLVTLFCVQTGIVLAVVFFVLSVSDTHRPLVVGIAAGVLLLGAAAAVLWLKWWLQSRRPMFETTMNELRKD